MLQLLASLQFFATGSFQSIAGDLLHISQSLVSRIVGKVAKVIAAHHQQFIYIPMPNETPLAFRISEVISIMLINDKMPTIVGILTFMSIINFMLS